MCELELGGSLQAVPRPLPPAFHPAPARAAPSPRQRIAPRARVAIPGYLALRGRVCGRSTRFVGASGMSRCCARLRCCRCRWCGRGYGRRRGKMGGTRNHGGGLPHARACQTFKLSPLEGVASSPRLDDVIPCLDRLLRARLAKLVRRHALGASALTYSLNLAAVRPKLKRRMMSSTPSRVLVPRPALRHECGIAPARSLSAVAAPIKHQ